MGLFVFTIYTLHRPDGDKYVAFGGAARARGADAAHCDPQRRGDVEARAERAAQREPGPRLPAWRTTTSVVLPAAAPGIISGAMLAIARAAGETAPLLFTIGLTYTSNWSLFHNENTTLSRQIFSNSGIGFPAATDRGGPRHSRSS